MINIEIKVAQGARYNFELKNSANKIIDVGYNQTGNLYSAHLSSGQFSVKITNLNAEKLELSVLKEVFPLVQNSDISGYNYKNSIFCWKVDMSISGFQKQFAINTIKKNYYYLTFVAQNYHVNASI